MVEIKRKSKGLNHGAKKMKGLFAERIKVETTALRQRLIQDVCGAIQKGTCREHARNATWKYHISQYLCVWLPALLFILDANVTRFK